MEEYQPNTLTLDQRIAILKHIERCRELLKQQSINFARFRIFDWNSREPTFQIRVVKGRYQFKINEIKRLKKLLNNLFQLTNTEWELEYNTANMWKEWINRVEITSKDITTTWSFVITNVEKLI
jgi:hypothetical protein